MRRRGAWWVISAAVILALALLWLLKPRSEISFLYDLKPIHFKVTDTSVSPFRTNEAVSFTFSTRQAPEVIAALHRFADRKHFRVFEYSVAEFSGGIRGDAEGIYDIAWMRLGDPVDRLGWAAPGERGDFAVNVFRNETPFEVTLHKVRQFFRLESHRDN
jgi:hypothetical protein